MAFESDSLNRRTLGPVVASAVVGVAPGVAGVLGLAAFSGGAIPQSNAVPAEQALLGDPEYGSRE